MERQPTWCRLAECSTGLLATTEAGALAALAADPDSPVGHAGPCATCAASLGARTDPRRLTRPRRRVGDRWEEVDWSTAIREIGGALKQIRRQSGPRSIGTYAGAAMGLDSHGAVRTAAWSLATGSPGLYSAFADHGAAWVRAAELVLGHPVALQSDLGRAHYAVLLGANQADQGWGPLQLGREHEAGLAHARKTKGGKLVALDPRRPPLAAGADIHLRVRPGTELWFVLGMVRTILDQGWGDRQYQDDWCSPLGPLRAALAPWTPERCAEVCGVAATDLNGVALKFSRAAMAVAHKSPQALDTPHGTLTAWALLVLHALTANLLRPGGLYDDKGLVPVLELARHLGTEGAPRTRTGGFPLVLLQAPGAILADEALAPGEGQLRALLCLHGDPLREQPGGRRLRDALAGLDLLVVMDVADSDTARLAHWVLPSLHPWEREDLRFADTALLGWRHAQRTPALVAAPGEARAPAWFLAELFKHLGPALRGAAFGPHLRLRGGRLVEADLDAWMARHLGGPGFPGVARLEGSGWDGGEVDRATWRVSTPSGRLELLPAPVADALRRLEPPRAHPGHDRWLLTSAARDPALHRFDRPPGDPGVTLHPSAGLAEGARARVLTPWGRVEATVRLDEHLRPDVVDLPRGYAADVAALVPTDVLDPFVGTPAWNGLSCRVEPV